jgi:hypothetical protein
VTFWSCRGPALFRDLARSAAASRSRRSATSASSAAIRSACAAISASRGSEDGPSGSASVTARNDPQTHAQPPRQHRTRRQDVISDHSPPHPGPRRAPLAGHRHRCNDRCHAPGKDAMAATLGNITFDCDDVLKLAALWSAVLGRPLDTGSSKVLRFHRRIRRRAAGTGLVLQQGARAETGQEPRAHRPGEPRPRCRQRASPAWRHGHRQTPDTRPALDRNARPGGQRILYRGQELHRL